MSRNAEIATLFEEFADLLEADGVEYKPRAYRRAAENIYDYPIAIEELASEGQDAVERIDGVGDALSSKVIEYVETGKIAELSALREELPVQIVELTTVEGVGPKTVGTLYRELGVQTLDDLERVATEGKIRELSGFGQKTEQNILDNLEFAKQAGERELLGHARSVADEVLDYLRSIDAVEACEVAGSIRRWRETIGDVDVLAASDDLQATIDALGAWPRVDAVIEAGENKSSVRARGMRIDLRVVEPGEFGSALQYFTGSRDHNVALRNRAIERGLKMNEYGVFDVRDVAESDRAGQRSGERVAGETEESMYEVLDLPWMPPEIREDTGEIAAAEAGTLPTLLERADVRGDLHTHTSWSDGNNSIEELVAAAEAFGHEYLCISDHATGPGMVGGVGVEDDELLEQLEEIERIDAAVEIDVFAGVEANVDAEGEISVRDDVLEALDLVVASPHSALDQGYDEATDRLVAAVSNPHVDVLGHPTGRLLNRRQGLEFSIRDVAAAAAASGTALEVNANPHRLDLNGGMVRASIEEGATIAINTDAHSPTEFEHVRFGVHTARRGWAERSDVLNAWAVEDVRAFLEVAD